MKFPPINELEPVSTRDATKQAVEILAAKYEKANLAQVVDENCRHLTVPKRNALLRLLLKHKQLFDGTLGDFKTQPVRFHLKKGERPCHGKVYPVSQSQMVVFKKEVERLCKIGVLKRRPESE